METRLFDALWIVKRSLGSIFLRDLFDLKLLHHGIEPICKFGQLL